MLWLMQNPQLSILLSSPETHLPGASMVIMSVAYSVTDFGTAEEWRRTRVEVSLEEVQLHRFFACAQLNYAVASRAAFTHSEAFLSAAAQLDANVEFLFPSFALAPPSEFFQPPLVCLRSAIQHLILRSISLVAGEIAGTFYRPEGDMRFAVCVAPRITRHRLLVA